MTPKKPVLEFEDEALDEYMEIITAERYEASFWRMSAIGPRKHEEIFFFGNNYRKE